VTYTVTLEHGSDGSYLAWVHELPGCFARGSSRADVEAQLPEAIGAFLAWLRGADDIVEDDDIAVEISDEVDSVIDSSEDTEVLLSADRQPLTEGDWETIERWLSHSRDELLELLSSQDLEEAPPGESRTLRELLVHIAFVELMYAAWTFDLSRRDGLREFLDWTRVISRARMRALAVRESGEVTQAEWAGAPRPEPWTARKAARRLIWHELLHLRDSGA
jgi:predicted RNase H-like HicB family nuclease